MMKKPEYILKQAVSFRPPGPMSDEVEFGPGTLVFPFWGKHYVPEHIKEQLKNTVFDQDRKVDPYITCIIGFTWLLIPESNIREVR